jgi:site-specific recombinase XerD
MLEDVAMRGLREETQRDDIRFVRSFAAFVGRPPDTATAEDVRRFQVHQVESGVQPPTINCSVSALRFFFTVTIDRPDLSRRPCGNGARICRASSLLLTSDGDAA